MSISYTNSIDTVTQHQLPGFFVGWPNPPSPQTHLRILRNSTHIQLALDEDTGQVIGFINAISDEVLSAYIPLLEVLPEYQGRGIGRELVERMLAELGDLYSIDLCCDPPLQQFYAGSGMQTSTGMMIRNFERQNGKQE